MANKSMTYNGNVINGRGEMLSLTDMWRAAGSEQNKAPKFWIPQDAPQEFISYISGSLKVTPDNLLHVERGRNGGTWAHWQIGLAYSKYLSPEFHAWCNQVVRDYMEVRGAPIQSMPAVVADEKGLVSALYAFAETITTAMGRQSGEIAEVKSDIGALKTGQARIEARIDEIAKRGRRRIKDSVKSQIVSHTHNLGGRCPCCGQASVTMDGYKLPHAEFDHFYANSAPDADHVWLICVSCHADLTRNVSKRDERNAEFQAFQGKRRRLPGAQIKLFEDAA